MRPHGGNAPVDPGSRPWIPTLRLTSSAAIRGRRHGGGGSRSALARSTACASCPIESNGHLRAVGTRRSQSNRFVCEIARAASPGARTISVMTTHRLPPLYRHAWWLPGAWSALAATLAVATLRPSEQSVLLMVAILCALPWSLALLLLDLSQGFADRAAMIVTVGLFANAGLDSGGSRPSCGPGSATVKNLIFRRLDDVARPARGDVAALSR